MWVASKAYYLTFAIFVSLTMAVVALSFVTPRPLTGDSHQQVRIAYHLIHTGVWGYDNVETPNPQPQIRREPLPILGSAGLMLLDPAFRAGFSIKDVTEGHLVTRIKRVNAVWIFLACFAIFLLTGEVIKSTRKAAIFSAILILISAYILFLPSMGVMHTEVQGTLFVTLSTWLGIRFTRDHSVLNAVLLGVGLGLLSLVKAAFVLIGIGYIGLLFIAHPSMMGATCRFSRPNLIRYGIIGVAFLATVAPWIARNAYTFSKPVITSRGGDVFAFRTMLTQDTLADWFYEFSPENIRTVISAVSGRSFDLGKIKARYNELKSNRWDLHYKKRLAAAGIKISKSRAEAEAWLAWQALKYNASHPMLYTSSSLLFAYRGIWFVPGGDFREPIKDPLRLAVTTVNGVAVLSFICLFVYGLVQRNPLLLALTGLGMGSFIFYSLFTHYHPRYSLPLTPIVFLSLLWCLNAIILKIRSWGLISRSMFWRGSSRGLAREPAA